MKAKDCWSTVPGPVAVAALCLIAVVCARTADGPAGDRVQSGDTSNVGKTEVTPVSGPSWLIHLGISDDMGRLGGNMPAPQSGREEPRLTGGGGGGKGMGMGGMMRRIYPKIRSGGKDFTVLMNESFELAGSDLYRLNCQSCHGPKGEGAPPEINSLIGPVQGTSIPFLQERMKKLGRSLSDSMARGLAGGADSTLRDRLQRGGKKMPAFQHLRGDEITALLQHLERLAGVFPPGEKEMLVPQSMARVGEHLVKGTCHICHSATGPGGGHMAMMQGIVPSLASMPGDRSLQEVVRQVRQGSSPMMSMMGGPVMPALPYITDDEAAAAYLYLMQYPPAAGS